MLCVPVFRFLAEMNNFDFSGPNLPKKEFSVVYLEN